MTTRVLLIDDHTLVRQAVAHMLDSHPAISVVGQAGSVAEGRALLAQHKVLEHGGARTVVVVDVSMPDGSGLALAREARRASHSLGIVVLTMHSDDATLLEALDAGASALVRKSSGAEEIVSAVLRAAETPLSFSAAGLADALRRRSEPKQTPLTARETEVLELLAEGSSVAQVGKKLYMSESTVKTHIAKIYDKLGVHNRAGAVMTAVRLGLVGGSGDPSGTGAPR